MPAGKLKELRMMVREREDIIEMGSAYVNKMGKCLKLMNLKLSGTLSQIQGASGQRIIEAIIAGERDPHKWLLLCDSRIIKAKSEDVLNALEGNYNAFCEPVPVSSDLQSERENESTNQNEKREPSGSDF